MRRWLRSGRDIKEGWGGGCDLLRDGGGLVVSADVMAGEEVVVFALASGRLSRVPPQNP